MRKGKRQRDKDRERERERRKSERKERRTDRREEKEMDKQKWRERQTNINGVRLGVVPTYYTLWRPTDSLHAIILGYRVGLRALCRQNHTP